MLTLGLLLGGLESTVTRDTWRRATTAQQAYFTALQQWGYPLSDVEQLVLTPTPASTTAPAVTTEDDPEPVPQVEDPLGDEPSSGSAAGDA